MDALHIL
jgi:flavin reductase (DIM6/NTAB) family NADH-FMN oxidoreductase RutF